MIRTLFIGAALAASAGAQAAPFPCREQALFDASAVRERVILVGELHGTSEMPAFASGLACGFLQKGRQVVLAMEVARDAQPEIERYLASDGGEPARQLLYASSFGRPKDGRGSLAYMGMIEQVRLLRQAGAPVSVAGADLAGGHGAATRDSAMAGHIAALARANPAAVVISLSGNLHAAKTKGGEAGAHYEPLGYLLSRQMPTHAIALAHDGGTVWACMPQCDTYDIGPWARGARPRGYDRVVKVGRLTASPPMRPAAAP
jgi:hypothetical protein